MVKNKNWIAEIFCNKFFDQPETCFTLSAEILAHSLADRDRNLLFMRCVNEQERLSMDPLGYRLVDAHLLGQCYDEIHDQ